MDISKVIQDIQYILAPAFMISSAGMLLLGFQTKFSNLSNRFRVLNHERQLFARQPQRSPEEERRYSNLRKQCDLLFRRATLVKNSILLTYSSIIFFTATSILILLSLYGTFHLRFWIIAVFAFGLLQILATAVIMLHETRLFYHILVLEQKSWNET